MLPEHTALSRIYDTQCSRVGGILSGKAGVMYCHMGTGSDLLAPLWQAVKETQVPISTFLPTHMERSEALIEDGAKWVKVTSHMIDT
jgi:beta-aspartyl-dipeptidase (metallo-type)